LFAYSFGIELLKKCRLDSDEGEAKKRGLHLDMKKDEAVLVVLVSVYNNLQPHQLRD
jgi:hypothetical protein